MKGVLENCRLKRLFECNTTGVVGGRGMCATSERSEIRKDFGKETRNKKNT
jgi:hypothetical protein